MSNENTQNQNNTISHTNYESVACIFKGVTKNSNGTYFADVALPVGKDNNDKQAFINVNAIVGKSPALQAFANGLCDMKLNDGKGTRATVTLSNVIAKHSFDSDGAIQNDKNGIPYINYNGFLNEISFK